MQILFFSREVKPANATHCESCRMSSHLSKNLAHPVVEREVAGISELRSRAERAHWLPEGVTRASSSSRTARRADGRRPIAARGSAGMAGAACSPRSDGRKAHRLRTRRRDCQGCYVMNRLPRLDG